MIEIEVNRTRVTRPRKMTTKWIPRVNNLKFFSRWKFIEITDLYELLE